METRSRLEGIRVSYRGRERRRARSLTLSFVAAGVLVVSNSPGVAAAPGTNFCGRTTRSELASCRSGARSDKLLAEGKCANISDATQAKACNDQAAADNQDALQLCKDQKGLRKGVCARLGPTPYAPVIDPANFPNSTTIDNPFFPLVPGTTFVYEGQTSEGFEHVEFAVTHQTKDILGVTCVEVHDTRQLGGTLAEDTRDWFAQDMSGNVWYFGENTVVLADGLPVDLSGTWTGGVDGAHPGIVMKASPTVGDFYRQEFLLDDAEDLAEVKSLVETVMVPLAPGTFDNCLETEESSPLAPGDVEHKFYAANVGNLLTIDMAVDPPERSELVEIRTGL
jgi:hypothetical protein